MNKLLRNFNWHSSIFIKKIRLKLSSVKRWPFCLGLNVLIDYVGLWSKDSWIRIKWINELGSQFPLQYSPLYNRNIRTDHSTFRSVTSCYQNIMQTRLNQRFVLTLSTSSFEDGALVCLCGEYFYHLPNWYLLLCEFVHTCGVRKPICM